jgi:hypothetical protein
VKEQSRKGDTLITGEGKRREVKGIRKEGKKINFICTNSRHLACF